MSTVPFGFSTSFFIRFLLIKNFNVLRVVPSPHVPKSSDQNKHSSSHVESVFDEIVVVEPAISLLRASFAPKETGSIENVAENDWTRNDSEEFDYRWCQADGDCFVFFLDAAKSHQEVCGAFGAADEFVDANDDEENVELAHAVDGAWALVGSVVMKWRKIWVDAVAVGENLKEQE